MKWWSAQPRTLRAVVVAIVAVLAAGVTMSAVRAGDAAPPPVTAPTVSAPPRRTGP